MKSKLKSTIVVLLSFISIVSLIIQPIYAAQEEVMISPRWVNVGSITLTIDLGENPVFVAATVVGATGTTYSNGTAKLYRDGYLVGSWTGISATTPYLRFSNQSVTRVSGTYELIFTITATRNGVSETVTASKTAKY